MARGGDEEERVWEWREEEMLELESDEEKGVSRVVDEGCE